MDRLLLARILLTISTIGYGLLTIKADFNKTHATNPLWTGHARFHVVWQVASYAGIGAIALALVWWPGPTANDRLPLAMLLAAAVYGAFFVALAAMPAFGGKTYDDNGYPPFALGGLKLDLNVTVFSLMTLLLAASAFLALA